MARMRKWLKTYAAWLSSFEAMVVATTGGIAVSGLSIVVNIWALLHGVYAASFYIAVSVVVITLQLASLVYARHRGQILAQELAEAKAKRAFAETMVEKMKTATGVTMGIERDDTDDDDMKRH